MPNTKALIVLDGWGYSQNTQHNAIYSADTPFWDKLIEQHPNTLLSCSGSSVGLPEGQIGNSEVGHMTMGAGRVLLQDLARINVAIEQGDFYKNDALVNTIKKAKDNNSTIHIMGLLSDGGVHSHQNHLFALLDLCKKQNFSNVLVHAFLDGRDTSPKSAENYLELLEEKLAKTKTGRIISISGRYYAMDRDKRYERTKLVYDLLTDKSIAIKNKYKNSIDALRQAYARNETDEFVYPTLIGDKHETIKDNDSIIFYNFRSDRAKQLSYAFLNNNFDGFKRNNIPALGSFVSFTEYAKNIPSIIAFPKHNVTNNLGEVIQNNNLAQLRIAETEKYAHVTFFFNGGTEKEYSKESRILIPSPKVATYNLKPEMSAIELTDRLVEEILSKKYDFILCNYANADMVGHTGDFDASVKAIEILDTCLDKVINAILKINGIAIITADHGNAEIMYNDKSHQPHTAHSNNLVPCVCISNQDVQISSEFKNKTPGLKDIAPSILKFLEIEPPKEMQGKAIFEVKI